LQSLALFWVAFGIFDSSDIISPDGKIAGVYVFGQWIASACILIVNAAFYMHAMNSTRLMFLVCLLGAVVYLFSFVVLGNWVSVEPDLFGINTYIFGQGMFYLYIFITGAICLIPLHLINQYYKYQGNAAIIKKEKI